MKSKTLKQMTDAQAIRIAELALANSLNEYGAVFIKRVKEEVDMLYIFYNKNYSVLDSNSKESIQFYKRNYYWVEIDSAFNVCEGANTLCNMDIISDLLRYWGFYSPKYNKTGIWYGKGAKLPKTIEDVADFKS
ncbi:MAG: hypothetical protein AABY22_11490 [Nanoarchaeota archaeon]